MLHSRLPLCQLFGCVWHLPHGQRHSVFAGWFGDLLGWGEWYGARGRTLGWPHKKKAFIQVSSTDNVQMCSTNKYSWHGKWFFSVVSMV